jgi:uncharacterized protein
MEESKTLTTPNLGSVRIRGGFWQAKQDINRLSTLPIEYEQLESTHRLEILKGNWTEEAGYTPHIFWDSDVAKWLEAAAYSLHSHPDLALEARCDEAIDDLEKLQGDDGYLNSYFSQLEPEQRWTNLRDRHELYCAGHLMEAAVAYAEATRKTKLLDVMCRYADYIDTVFGPEEGQKKGYPGHEEIELALVKLYKATGNLAYLRLSEYFLTQRGTQPHYYDTEAEQRGDESKGYRFGKYDYLQAHAPVREQTTAEGHSVRACYLYAGMADVARETGDPALKDACAALWKNITRSRMYVNGGIGSSHLGERFTYDYDLPNEAAYAETCAAIALVFFAQRMFLLEQKGNYIDVLERALYNGVISGVSEDGKRFFYDNYLESHPGYHDFQNRTPPDRQEWFGCACCPPNLARLLASLGSYLFVESPSDLWLNLYADYTASTATPGFSFTMQTRYPWDGNVAVKLSLAQARRFTVRFRIPSWCRNWTGLVNGAVAAVETVDGYAVIDREWENGDEIVFDLVMSVERVYSHPSVRSNIGKFALQRGPLVYCLEDVDNGKDLNNLFVPSDLPLAWSFEEQLLGGVVTISGEGTAFSYDGWEHALYHTDPGRITQRLFKAVPYYSWNNRGVGEMLVWLNAPR